MNLIIIIAFPILLILAVILRVKMGDKYEIKTSDITLAVVLLGFVLFLTGHAKSLKFGEVELVSALKDAYDEKVEDDFAAIDSEVSILDEINRVSSGIKGGTSNIPDLSALEIEALMFNMAGNVTYTSQAIEQYMNQIPSLKYIIVNDASGNFQAMLEVNALIRYVDRTSGSSYDDDDYIIEEGQQEQTDYVDQQETISSQPQMQQQMVQRPMQTQETQLDSNSKWQAFTNALNRADLAYLEKIPSYTGNEHIITQMDSRKVAMEKFQESKLATLPVIDEGNFLGILERDNLANQILVSITSSVE